MRNRKKSTVSVSREAQTIIQRKCQTEITIRPEEDNQFYSMLEYLPNQDIQQEYVRIIDLPRKPRLQIVTHGIERLHLQNCLSLDDDGISELCLELRERLRAGLYKQPKTFHDVELQTDMKVAPHVLDEDDIATVRMDRQSGEEGSPTARSGPSTSDQRRFHFE